jgi:tRNA(Arg) A34 adenosine deaminase TadA
MAATLAQIRLPDWLAEMALPATPASDEACMRFAITAASENVKRGTGGPFGAVIRNDETGEVVGVGVNVVLASGNAVLHAETVAISLAGPRVWHGATLFTSCEPCIMCLGASHWARLARIVSAALKEDAEAAGFSEGAGTEQLRAEMEARGVTFRSGFMREDGVAVLRDYNIRGLPVYGPQS